MRGRTAIFAVVAALCVFGGIGSVVMGALGKTSQNTDAKVGVVGTIPVGRLAALHADSDSSALPAAPVQTAEPGPGDAMTAVVAPHPSPEAPRTLIVRAQNPTNLALNGAITTIPIGGGAPSVAKSFCERLDFSGPRGICLSTLGANSEVTVLDRRLNALHTINVPGIPSRARVSPDGRFGSITTFIVGHAYAAPGTFSTYTALIDLVHGKVIANLEQFKTYRDGQVVQAPDVNYWGVTFTGDDRHFFATLATGGKTYLVFGDIARREMRTVQENVECPSLSPDGTRIAFKKRVGGPKDWHLTVLDLRTMRETPLAENRSIDDQIEWLDDNHVLYSDGQDVWSAQADGGGTPQRLLSHAASPSVVWGS
jgi:hypothetical protein